MTIFVLRAQSSSDVSVFLLNRRILAARTRFSGRGVAVVVRLKQEWAVRLKEKVAVFGRCHDRGSIVNQFDILSLFFF